MAPIRKNPSKKKITHTMRNKKRRSNDCCAISSSSSSYESSSESSDTSSETDSTDCICSDSDCSDCWDCEAPSRKRGGKRFKGKTSKAHHKGKKKTARRAKYSSSCDSSPCESSDDCYECVPKKPGRKARA